ncbi:hypothetical protein JX266_007823 [Neoarthrinium moseri]|nr:hypothetical protein JX266_007823 [Neoarthrinium moseri]
MAGRKRVAASRAGASRQTRGSAARGGPPDVYREMLADVDVRAIADPEEPPPKRRRRPGEKSTPTQPSKPRPKTQPPPPEAPESDEDDGDIQFEDVAIPVATIQTMFRDSEEEDDDDDDDDNDDEEDLQFEDVDLSFPDLNFNNTEPEKEEPKDLVLNLTARATEKLRHVAERRKPINRPEKDRRIEIHKTHLLCLLSHVAQRNRWCNDAEVQRTLRRLLNREMVKYLNPGRDLTQFGQTNSLKTGLQKVEIMFRTRYEITERGIRRALWADKEEHLKEYRMPSDAESPMERPEFREAAKKLKGSRDVGAQLYCALLRSAGVEARLVCSLQPLTFASGGPSMSKPPRSRQKLSLEEQYARRPKYDSSFDSPALNTTSPIRRRMGHPNATAFNVPLASSPIASAQPSETTKKIRECPFPVYWVEVLDVAHQKWQPVDPLVTQSFWKPQLFEPPASERENCMTYVVGFEADGTAKDVTRRYTKAYNAKTRKLRIESTAANGDKWWRKALKAYRRRYPTDLDQIESNELAAAEAREPMPRNVADFKDHPIYALERHLRRHEVLVPGATAAGTVGAGSKGPLERIYRRKDVRIARTRDKWYRMGREVLGDQIPIKFLPKRLKKRSDLFGDDEELEDGNEGDIVGTPIFTMDQTILYKAPPVVNGVVPKNRFGNLDIYVPSMVPEGGAYVADDLGAQAAFTLGIDYAPALTGFSFKGRKGTAVLYGVVVASEHEEAVRATIEGLRDQEAEYEQERRTREVLKTWKRFLMNLRVRQRIWAGVDEDAEAREEVVEDIAHEQDDQMEEDEEDRASANESGDDFAGGFIVDEDADYGPGGF